jgi:L-alanine-DL-glutamate epimerase-like enolase superfamily enzyme
MRLTGVRAWQIDLPLHEGSYKWSGGNSVEIFDSTVVAVDTDAGITGFGEVCPLGPAYLPAYARGARTGIAELAPHILPEDSWGGDITTAAIAHLAHSTPSDLLFSSTDFNSYVTVPFADGAPHRDQGRLAASLEPGLGVHPRLDVLGETVVVVREGVRP